MTIGILAEYRWNSLERRVALVPESVRRLAERGFRIVIERGAGELASLDDALYQQAGALIVPDAVSVLSEAEILCTLTFPVPLAEQLRQGQVLITLVQQWKHADVVENVVGRGVRILALERIPRTSRAQAMDVLSSMATVAGYRAAIVAAERLPRFFPMLVSAAGTIPPAECLVIGAGVAGLQAIATARRLGAQVSAYDVRPAAQEQIASLGGRPIRIEIGTVETETAAGYARQLADEQLQRQRDGLSPYVARADVVITTAAVPGKRAPLLVSTAMLEAMKPGAIIVDLAAESGGNTEQTQPGKEVVLSNGVTILAPLLLPAQLPHHASMMFSRNLTNLLLLLATSDGVRFHLEDDILRAMAIERAEELSR
ncbi:MAG: NAD(P) transhydrogenase subunit alpha [Candidatus Kapaibacterium sp.]|nr:MAG: NAD(P) transhydrogenase subunit alpha [Candidatus Kapabacteria bacterium]